MRNYLLRAAQHRQTHSKTVLNIFSKFHYNDRASNHSVVSVHGVLGSLACSTQPGQKRFSSSSFNNNDGDGGDDANINKSSEHSNNYNNDNKNEEETEAARKKSLSAGGSRRKYENWMRKYEEAKKIKSGEFTAAESGEEVDDVEGGAEEESADEPQRSRVADPDAIVATATRANNLDGNIAGEETIAHDMYLDSESGEMKRFQEGDDDGRVPPAKLPYIAGHTTKPPDNRTLEERMQSAVTQAVAKRMAEKKSMARPYILCPHKLFRHQCLVCSPRSHTRRRGASFSCEHGRKWKFCHLGPACGGRVLCTEHHDMNKAIWVTRKVSTSDGLSWNDAVKQYPGTQRWECRFCRGFVPCPHGLRKSECAVCPDGGQSLCIHGKPKHKCALCLLERGSKVDRHKYKTLEKVNDMIVSNGGVPLSRHEINLTYCEHGNKRGFCPAPPPHGCGDTANYCEHGSVYWLCQVCNPKLKGQREPSGRTHVYLPELREHSSSSKKAGGGSGIDLDSMIMNKIEHEVSRVKK